MQIKSTRNTLAIALAFTTLSGLSTMGNANLQAVDVKSVQVSYADLNLARQEGQHTLYMRLRGAADAVCGEVQSRAAAEVREKRECFQNALNRALKEVGSEELHQLHKS
ncbi:MAG: UrcA family protein [Halieaceae bacterium]